MGFFRRSSSSTTSAVTAAVKEQECSHSPAMLEAESLHHNLQPGDHVLTWTNLLFYPIQVHGIVLSAGAGLVTIIDFGLSSVALRPGNKDNQITELVQQASRDRRLNIITLTEQKEVEQWKKVNYGESLLSNGKWAKILSWFRKKNDEEDEPVGSPIADHPGRTPADEVSLVETKGREQSSEDREEFNSPACRRLSTSSQSSLLPPPDKIFAQQKEAEGLLAWLEQHDSEEDDDDDQNTISGASSSSDENERRDSTSEADTKPCDPSTLEGAPPKTSKNDDAESTCTTKRRPEQSTSPRLPKSDPAGIVLSRVRFLLSEDGNRTLPPHNVLFANSECIAVWCKTGRFSTIQSQIFLHSTALGNAKTVTTVALIVGAQTVTVTSTIPAAGFWGWLGFTTTTTSQVGLLSVNPWIIPVLAGCGIAAVGTPYLVLHQAQGKWEKATTELNDAFWQLATPDTYVEAIQHWSGIVH